MQILKNDFAYQLYRQAISSLNKIDLFFFKKTKNKIKHKIWLTLENWADLVNCFMDWCDLKLKQKPKTRAFKWLQKRLGYPHY